MAPLRVAASPGPFCLAEGFDYSLTVRMKKPANPTRGWRVSWRTLRDGDAARRGFAESPCSAKGFDYP